MARATLARGIAGRADAALDLTGSLLAEEPRQTFTVAAAPGGARAAHACRTAAAAAAPRDAGAPVIAGARRVLDGVLAPSRRTLRSGGISTATAGAIAHAIPSTGGREVLLAVVAWVLTGGHRRTGPLPTGCAAGEAALNAGSVATVPAGAVPGRTSSTGLATLTLGERWSVGAIDERWHVCAATDLCRSIALPFASIDLAPIRSRLRVRTAMHEDARVLEVYAATSQGDDDHPAGRTTDADPRRQRIIARNHEGSLPPPPSSVVARDDWRLFPKAILLCRQAAEATPWRPSGKFPLRLSQPRVKIRPPRTRGRTAGRRDPPTISGAVVSPTEPGPRVSFTS
jgi:hypothetical protein